MNKKTAKYLIFSGLFFISVTSTGTQKYYYLLLNKAIFNNIYIF